MGRIEASDLVAPKVLEPFRNEVDLSTESLKTFNEALQKDLELMAKLAGKIKVSTQGLQQMTRLEQKSKNTLTQKQKVQKKINTLQQKNTQISKLQRQRVAALRVEEQRRQKIAKQQAILDNKSISAFERLNVKIKQLSDRYRHLLVQEGKETAQTRVLKKQIQELTAVRNRANQSIGIGTGLTKGFRAGISKLTAALGRLGLAFGVFAIIRDTFGVMKDFDQATADLSAVLGVTREEMAELTEQSKELGATTKFTASEISNLQLELAKLGFTQQQIQEMTGATLELAAAAGVDLAAAATVTGSTLRGFGLEASETQRVVDVMAKSFSSSSLDMSKFQTAMASVAPVAKALGISIEEATALIGTLTDAGIDAGTAGAGLRNLFLDANKAGLTLTEALDLVNNSSDKVSKSFELFGKRGATLGVILAENQDATAGLTDTLNEAGGAAGEMADKQLDTLQGALDLLRSAWEGYILGADGAGGITEKLKNIVKFLANNLEIILDTIFFVIKAWGAYKIATLAATVATKAYTLAQTLATKGLKAFTVETKLNPFGLIASALVILLPLLASFAGFTKDATEEVKELTRAEEALNNVSQKTSEKLADEQAELIAVFDALKATTAGTKERQEALDEVNAKYGLTLQNLSDEAEFVDQLNMAYNDLLATLEKRIRMEAVQEELTTLIKERIKLQKDLVFWEQQAQDQMEETNKTFTDFDESKFEDAGLGGRNLAEQTVSNLKEDLSNVEEAIRALQGDVAATDLIGTLLGDTTGDGTSDKTKKTVKSIKTEIEILRQGLKDLIAQNRTDLKAIEVDLRRQGKNEEEIARELKLQRMLNAQEELEFAKKHLGELSEEAIALELEFMKATEDLNKFIVKQREKREKEEEAERIRLQNQRVSDIKNQSAENLKIIENEGLKAGKKREQIDKELREQNIRNLQAENEFFLKEFGEFSEEYLDANLALNRALAEQDREAAEKKKELQEELIESIRNSLVRAAELIETVFERNLKLIDRQIEEQKRLFDESKDREQELKEIAKERELDATESINAEREAQKKALLLQQDLERKRQRAEALIAGLRAMAAQIEQGQGNPIANIKTQISNLKSFIEGQFYHGAPYTFGDALGTTGTRDGHVVAVDDGESIFTGKQTRDLNIGRGKNSTQDIVDMYKKGFNTNAQLINEVQLVEGETLMNKKVLNELTAVKNELKRIDPAAALFDGMTGYMKYMSKSKGEKYRYPVRKPKNG